MNAANVRPLTTGTGTLRRAATIGAGGALITIAGATITLILTRSTTTSSERWSYPFTARAHILFSFLWLLSHVLLFMGLDGLRRSHLVGTSRQSTRGVRLALAGTALLGVGEVASMLVADADVDDGAAMAAGAVFGIGSLLTAVGMVMLGLVVLRERQWRGGGRAAALVLGLVNTVQLALGPTDLFLYGIIAYGAAALWLMLSFARQLDPAARPVTSTSTAMG